MTQEGPAAAAGVKEGFERVFNIVGSSGPFQYVLLLIVSLQCLILTCHHLGYVFLGAVPDHWCRIPELDDNGWSREQIRNLSIPLKRNGQGWESCEFYDLDYAHLSTMPYEEALSDTLIEEKQDTAMRRKCENGWIFDNSIYESTLVTEFQIVCENRYLAPTIQASYMTGVFIGSLILGSLSDQVIGRRTSILISVILVLVGGVAAAFSSSYWAFIIFRFFVAFGVAGAYQNCYVLLLEYTGTSSRSMMGMVQQLPFALGYMLMTVYAYYIRDWKTLQLAYSLSAIILISYFWILPESARWLAVSGKSEKSLNLLMKVAKKNKKEEANREEIFAIVNSCCEKQGLKRGVTFTIEDIPASAADSVCAWITKVWNPIKKTLSIYLRLLATPEMRRRTLLVWFLFISVDLVYYGVVFDSATLTSDPYMVVFLGGLSEVPAYTLIVPFLAKWGRRPTIVVTYFLTAVCTLLVAYVSAEHETVRLLISMSGKLFITTCFAVIYLLGTELYPTSTRTTGLAAAVFMGRVGSILAPFVVDGMKSVYRDLPNIIFGIVCVLSGAVSLLIPETNDVEMADKLCDVEEGGGASSSKKIQSQQTDSIVETASVPNANGTPDVRPLSAADIKDTH